MKGAAIHVELSETLVATKRLKQIAIRNHRGLTSRTRVKSLGYRPHPSNALTVSGNYRLLAKRRCYQFVKLKRSFRKSVANSCTD